MKNFSLMLFLAVPVLISIVNNGAVLAQEDVTVDDISEVDGDEASILTEDELDEESVTASSDAETTILFTKPIHTSLSGLELPAGNWVQLLVGFTNKGKTDFILETIDASFRYPMDFNFYIQNFTHHAVDKVVKPYHEATIAYSFVPSETFAGRPFGLNVNLNYKDMNGHTFSEAVYNDTIQVVELDEGLDGETIFLYIFLTACVVLTLVGGQQLLSSLGRKSRSSSVRRMPVEMGTSNPNNVDFDWLPKDTLNRINQSPRTPRSPRQRRAKRSVGSED